MRRNERSGVERSFALDRLRTGESEPNPESPSANPSSIPIPIPPDFRPRAFHLVGSAAVGQSRADSASFAVSRPLCSVMLSCNFGYSRVSALARSGSWNAPRSKIDGGMTVSFLSSSRDAKKDACSRINVIPAPATMSP